MAYAYYCSYCGIKLTQETVLFDMQYLLTQHEDWQAHILKFRVTQEELKALIASGTPAENGYRKCRLTLADVMGIVANENNLNDRIISELTLEEIDEYLNDPDDLVRYCRPIHILRHKGEQIVCDPWFAEEVLRQDLRLLQRLFAENETYDFLIREENDIDNDGNEVLEGYSLHSEGGVLRIQERICPQCGREVFAHAGTAPQKVVTFVGHGGSGRTSTILALTHYATHYMASGFGSKIWEGCRTIDSVASVEWLDRNEWSVKQLEGYKHGIAPDMGVLSRDYDTIATLCIQNKTGRMRHILTLVRPNPGCYDNAGNLNREAVMNCCPIVLETDVFVTCCSSSALRNPNHGTVAAQMGDVLGWTDEFQRMRAQHHGVNAYIPVMLLFTKCDELAAPDATAAPSSPMSPAERMYLLAQEKLRIWYDQLYSVAHQQLSRFSGIHKAYHAAMCSTVFGFNAPRNVEAAVEMRQPMPQNIDLLMRWLLRITGCIPTEAKLDGKPGEQTYRVVYRLERPQLRSQNPLPGKEIEEAMARCTLFENPGYFDREFALKHDRGPFVLAPVRLDAKLHPDTNDR